MSKKSVSRPSGYILHQDRQRVVIATGFDRKSENPKTGDMLQIWILARRENPLRAIETGKDSLVCGECPLRGLNGQERTCYVNLGQAPYAIWRKYARGGYKPLPSVEVFRGRKVRFGAYGDPVFIPYQLVTAIAAVSAGWTGYTHQWRNPLFRAYRKYVMASVESVEGFRQAQAAGWRTFRVATNLDTLQGELICVNTTHGVTCADCKLCAGTATRAKSILIEAHGAGRRNLGKVS